MDIKFVADPRQTKIFLNMIPVPVSNLEPQDPFFCCAGTNTTLLPTACQDLVVDSIIGVPFSAKDMALGVVAPQGCGKSTICRILGGITSGAYDPDFFFPPGSEYLTTQEKYSFCYLDLVKYFPSGLFFFHDFSVVPSGMRVVCCLPTESEVIERTSKRGSWAIDSAVQNQRLVSTQLKQLKWRQVRRIPLTHLQNYCCAAFGTTFLENMSRRIYSGADGSVFQGESAYRYTYTPLPGRSISKLLWTLSDPQDVDNYVLQVVECLWPSVSHHPIWDAWLRRLYYLYGGCRRVFCHQVAAHYGREWQMVGRVPRARDPWVWEWLSKRYALPVSDLEEAVQFLSRLERGSNYSECPALVAIMDLDWRPYVLT